MKEKESIFFKRTTENEDPIKQTMAAMSEFKKHVIQ